MKKYLTMILATLMLATAGLATAQSHRHTQRGTVDTVTIIEQSSNQMPSAADIENFEQNMEQMGEHLEAMGEHLDETLGNNTTEMVGTLFNDLDESHVFDYALLIPILAIIGFFFAPVLIVGFILLYRYKRRKQRDMVVMAAINKGVEIPSEYRDDAYVNNNPSAKGSSARTSGPLLQKGIRRIALGIGFFIIGIFLHTELFSGIGMAIGIYGIGEIIIHYLAGSQPVTTNSTQTEQQSANHQESNKPQKSEGTYEKSE